MTQHLLDEEFCNLTVPVLGITFGAYCTNFLALNKVKKMLEDGMNEVKIENGIAGYCESLLERYGSYSSVVMYPEAGILGHVFATVYNIKINVYDYLCVLKESYVPMRNIKREPLLVNLMYKFGVEHSKLFLSRF
jgi:hypothetical protein